MLRFHRATTVSERSQCTAQFVSLMLPEPEKSSAPDLDRARMEVRSHEASELSAMIPLPMIAVMWQFDVKKGREDEFEKLYGADGDWTALNRQTRSYLGSSFLRDQNRPSRYLLIEYWSEMLVYEQHRTSRSAKIDAIETQRAELVDAMEPRGIYAALDVPDRWGPTWSQRR
jgi:quinol monooxygenase YgiN